MIASEFVKNFTSGQQTIHAHRIFAATRPFSGLRETHHSEFRHTIATTKPDYFRRDLNRKKIHSFGSEHRTRNTKNRSIPSAPSLRYSVFSVRCLGSGCHTRMSRMPVPISIAALILRGSFLSRRQIPIPTRLRHRHRGNHRLTRRFMGVFMGLWGDGWEWSGPRYFSSGVKTLSVALEFAVTSAVRGFVPIIRLCPSSFSKRGGLERGRSGCFFG